MNHPVFIRPSRAARASLYRYAFTLIELLVVISIIALLVGILLPALGAARKTAQDAACKSNIRTIGQALHMYVADELDGYLPPSWVYTSLPGVSGEFNWYQEALNSYLDHDGFNGVGMDYLRCPTQEEDCYRTYGANYYGPTWYHVSSPYGGTLPSRMDDLENNWYIIGDIHGRNWGHGDYNRGGHILNHQRSWVMDTDWDGDGINDSNSGELAYEGPYNGFGPWHFRAGNFVFRDGHAESRTAVEWATNDRGLVTPNTH